MLFIITLSCTFFSSNLLIQLQYSSQCVFYSFNQQRVGVLLLHQSLLFCYKYYSVTRRLFWQNKSVLCNKSSMACFNNTFFCYNTLLFCYTRKLFYHYRVCYSVTTELLAYSSYSITTLLSCYMCYFFATVLFCYCLMFDSVTTVILLQHNVLLCYNCLILLQQNAVVCYT